MDSSSDSFCETAPEEVEETKNVSLASLPTKSREKYENSYRKFMDYRQEQNITSISENVLMAYFEKMSKEMKSSTLWCNYSMLRSTLAAKESVDIARYYKLRSYLKKQSSGYKPKKSKILKMEEVRRFLSDAPDKEFLLTKVAVIFGIYGACRREELSNLKVDDIEDLGNKLLVNIKEYNTSRQRSFIVKNDADLDIYRKYSSLRPVGFENSRFFFNYQCGKGRKQVVGVHKFGSMPRIVATFLNLPSPKNYTGHCFRRSSTTMLMYNDSDGRNLTFFKRRRGWTASTVVAEDCIDEPEDESMDNKAEVAKQILNYPPISPSSTHSCEEEDPLEDPKEEDTPENTDNFINFIGPTSSMSTRVKNITNELPTISNCTNCTFNFYINK